MHRLFAIIGVSIALAAGGCAQDAVKAEPSPRQKQVAAEFQKRVNDYMKLRKKQAGTAPAPSSSPDKLIDAQKALAAKMGVARANAKQGDIFTPEIAAYFRNRIAATMKGTQGAKIRSSLRHAEPLHGIALQVNGTYPAALPLQSTPASLLLNLPPLPKELEYRIVNHDLVLHDIAANLVVDVVPNAIAAP